MSTTLTKKAVGNVTVHTMDDETEDFTNNQPHYSQARPASRNFRGFAIAVTGSLIGVVLSNLVCHWLAFRLRFGEVGLYKLIAGDFVLMLPVTLFALKNDTLWIREQATTTFRSCLGLFVISILMTFFAPILMMGLLAICILEQFQIIRDYGQEVATGFLNLLSSLRQNFRRLIRLFTKI